MQFFTKEWATGLLSDDAWQTVRVQYTTHIEKLLPQFPVSLVELATQVSLHDGLIQQITIDTKHRYLDMLFRCGDQQVGYFDLKLLYTGVLTDSLDLDALSSVASNQSVECLFDEIDLESKQIYVHRLLFSSGSEIAIRFAQLELRRKPMPNRIFNRQAEPYTEIS